MQSQTYFADHNVTAKVPGTTSLWKGPLRVIERIFRIFPLLFVGLLGAIAFLLKAKKHYSSQLFRLILLWTFAVLGAFSLSNFAAPRYFLVLIVPIALVIPLAIQQIMLKSKSDSGNFSLKKVSSAGLLLLLVFLISTGYSLFRVGTYLASPQFTLVKTADRIERYITSDSSQSNVVMGHFADTIALTAQDVKAVNDRMGFRSLEYRLERFDPSYYISIGEIIPYIEETLENSYQLIPLEEFDLYQNRDYGEPVLLYRLNPLPKDG